MADADDVNGDGIPDVIVGAPRADNSTGRAEIGLGLRGVRKGREHHRGLAALGAGGFPNDGAAALGRAGRSVADADDVNGDGIPDVIVGPTADNDARTGSGSAYVVFGTAASANVDLATLGAGGFRIGGAAAGDFAGVSVAGAGDVNGDERPDVIVGAPFADNNWRANSGSAYVVFGSGRSLPALVRASTG